MNAAGKQFFDKVFSPRFGMLTKSELELELFRVYFEEYAGENWTDFKIGRELGITESRVSNLRLKLALLDSEQPKEPYELILGEAVEYDPNTSKVSIRINSAFQRAALKDYLEEKGTIPSIPLGSNHIKLTLSNYLDVLAAVFEDTPEDVKNRIDKLVRDQKDLQKAIRKINKKSFIETILDPDTRNKLAFIIVEGTVSGVAAAFASLIAVI